MLDADLRAALAEELRRSSAAADEPPVRPMPPVPSSVSLFLTAVGSLGAWHLARSARKLHLGHVPEWFHTGCPSQIGHASVIDLSGTVPVCRYEKPPGETPAFHFIRRVLRLCPRVEAQHFLTAMDTRAPPLLCP